MAEYKNNVQLLTRRTRRPVMNRYARVLTCVTFAGLVGVCGCKSSAITRSGGAAPTTTSGTAPADVTTGTTPGTVAATDFRDPTQLATDLEQQVNNRLSDPSNPNYQPGVTVTALQCEPINGSRTDFECVMNLSNQQHESDEAIVAPDGQSYVTK